MKKGQAALEYLLTYGWAILMVIIVGASVYALGIFTPGQWTGQRQTGFAAFNVVDFKLDEDSTLIIIFENRIGKTINLNDVTATFRGQECEFNISEVYDGQYGVDTTNTTSISPGKRYWTELDCPADAELGASYSINVGFEYEDPDSGLTHIDAGTLIGAVEPAQ